MNPYFKLIGDIVALLETKEFAQVIVDIRAIEGGAGTHLTGPGAADAVKRAIVAAAALPDEPKPFSVPGQKPT